MGLFEEDVEDNIRQLHLLAWGDLDIVEQALTESLEKVRPVWWKFWVYDWQINFSKAAKLVVERRRKIEEITPIDHDSINIE
jgi:hypothetical protein